MAFKFKSIDGLVAYIISMYRILNFKTLESILSDSNAYDHNVITWQEINEGLSRLESDNWLLIQDSRIAISNKLKQIIKENTKFFDGQFDVPVRLQNRFGKMESQNDLIYKEYVALSDYEKALKLYLKRYGLYDKKELEQITSNNNPNKHCFQLYINSVIALKFKTDNTRYWSSKVYINSVFGKRNNTFSGINMHSTFDRR